MTNAEQILWHFLRNRRFYGYKFRRQTLIDFYIVDFVCFDNKLVIELDGGQHLEPDKIEYDKKRSEYLNSMGFKVIRYYNTDIFKKLESVLENLKLEVENTPSSAFQAPSHVEGEGCIVSNKKQLRTWAKEERKKLDIKALSEKLVRKLQQTSEYKQAKNIMIFYPMKDEVNLLSLLDDKTKEFYLPKIQGDNLLCCPYDKEDELCETCFKTKEPLSEPVERSLIDLVIVPALAVDENNYRLGYGGGFYDRFLSGAECKKIVCIPYQLIVETVYPEDFDIPVDKVITD